jgi:hypothetical protein
MPSNPVTGVSTSGLSSSAPAAPSGIYPEATGGGAEAVAPYDLGDVSGDVAISMANGTRQYGWADGDFRIMSPTGATVDGLSEVTLIIGISGGNHAIDFEGTIEPDVASVVTFPKALVEGNTYRIKLGRQGGLWCLLAMTGGHQAD